MATLKVKNNGVWERVSGGGSSPVSDRLIVTIDAATMTASHSASEICEAKTAGKFVYATVAQSGATLSLFSCSEADESLGVSSKVFFISSTFVETDKTAHMLYMMVADDKTVTYEQRILVGLPSVGTAGQVLAVGEDGNPVWENAPSNIPSGGTTGQVLTIGEDGNIVWANVTGGNGGNNTLPAAEEVEF